MTLSTLAVCHISTCNTYGMSDLLSGVCGALAECTGQPACRGMLPRAQAAVPTARGLGTASALL